MARSAGGEGGAVEPSYYDIPMLKEPVWTPEVGGYFFLGGVSAGAFLLARLAERMGGDTLRALTRTGTVVAAIAAVPCAPLLIMDLGDPARFHHMLRVFKPQSPMNVGSWTLTAYSGTVALAALREWLRATNHDEEMSGGAALAALTDISGIPLALLLAGYTGVLLSGTATPIWSRNAWLGPLFSAGAFSNGTTAVTLALEALNGDDNPSSKALAPIRTAAHLTEAATLGGFLASAGERVAPLTGGKEATTFWGGAVAAGLVLPELLEHLPVPPRAKRWVKIAASLLGLAGGLALRLSIVQAGKPSARDPEAAREVSRPQNTKSL